MIAIADSGSTKCDWILLDDSGKELLRTSTMGFSPNIMDTSTIPAELHKNDELALRRSAVQHIYFYGTGCGIEENCQKIQSALNIFFVNAQIRVSEDLTAAAYAAYNGVPAIVGILGTGSNTCYFDGSVVRRDLPSLGFLLGDEGSGSALGKALVRDFFMKRLPEDLDSEFRREFPVTIDEFITNIYHRPRVNTYLAAFSKFIHTRKEHPFLQHLIFDEFKSFFEFQVLPYPESTSVEVNFIGSIAYYYEDILRSAAAEYHITVGTIVQKPIERLVDFHRRHILPNIIF